VNAIDAQAIADYLVDLIQQDEELWSDEGSRLGTGKIAR